MSEVMLKISHISKQYKLGQIGGTTLREEIQRWNAKRRHEEDPTRNIGARDYVDGETFMALDDVSLEVKKGERVGIIGHNGAGKSTLLKLISRITAPSSGDIWMNGRVASMLEVGTGFHGELTGRENIYMNGAILGMKKKEIDDKIEDIIEFSECRQFIDTPVKRYSSGMYVKLAFSVAAHLDSEIMIMDEVLAVGDMAFQKKCLEKMSDVSNSEGRTILYVSHNMNTIRQLCDRCIVLDHGKVIFDGGVESAINVYLGSRNLSHNKVDLEHFERNPEFASHPATMLSLEIKTTDSVFTVGEKLKGILRISSISAFKNVFLSIPVRTVEGISVTSFRAFDTFELNDSEVTEIEFELDISCIAPGQYTLNPVISVKGELGAKQFLDGILFAYRFEIADKNAVWNGEIWQTKFAGYYIAPPIKIKTK